MKKLILIPAICLLCFSCNRNGSSNNNHNDCANRNQNQETSADWSITTKVKSSIMSDTSLSGTARFVSVSTTDGVVTLSGTVPSRDDSDRIVKIAKNVRGVVRVDNQMLISNK